MDIEDLRSPHPSDFIQPSREDDINPPATDLFIGKQALAALFYDDGDGLNGKDETYHEYSRELIELIVENETPFSTIHTTRETLNIAVTSLDHRRNNREAADTCLDTVLNNDLFQIHHCELTEYVRSVDCFVDYNPRDISI